jgi:hypothetical protein
VKCLRIRALPALVVLLFATALPGGAQVKQHQATGTVLVATPVEVTILKKIGRNTTKWNFVVNAKTKLETKPAKSMRVRIYYHEEKNQRIADRIKPAPLTSASPPATSQAPSKN